MTGISLFGQVTDNYKHNPYKRDPIGVAELKNNIEITGKNCNQKWKDEGCDELYVKNKTNSQFWMLIKGTSFFRGNGWPKSFVICLKSNENRKILLESWFRNAKELLGI